ncbi:hypothetical protein [Burkholderia sp. ABCPW 14]|uniref:hypothetical protein n=1 Tax=Burkholderia sp. ABCPW 14 TaxID=1637860 RepID=UPI001E29CE10|nr:hypothetical protein [Burkholderia sp. ABCPW 14]
MDAILNLRQTVSIAYSAAAAFDPASGGRRILGDGMRGEMRPWRAGHMLSLICNRSLPVSEQEARRGARRLPRFFAIRRIAAGPRSRGRVRSCAPPCHGALRNCNLQQMGVARGAGFRYIRLMRQARRRSRCGGR